MLKIKYIEKIRNRPLDKQNFYVEYVREIFDMQPGTFTTSNHRYVFGITNRKYAITITLDREIEPAAVGSFYKLHSSTGHKVYITKSEISNMDKFIDKLRLVALSK